jgi:hypothetical protein
VSNVTGQSTSASPHLWEVEHDYYCNEGNYFSNDCHAEYSRWQDFAEATKDEDFDYNLVFRWDWKGPTDDSGENVPPNADPYYRDGRLLIFYMGQRKGLYRYVEVSVCQADEPAVREWLKPRLAHLLKLWAPLVEAQS